MGGLNSNIRAKADELRMKRADGAKDADKRMGAHAVPSEISVLSAEFSGAPRSGEPPAIRKKWSCSFGTTRVQVSFRLCLLSCVVF